MHVRLYFNSGKEYQMSFIKPLSIEQIFAKFNTNGGEEIDEQEANDAKNINIF